MKKCFVLLFLFASIASSAQQFRSILIDAPGSDSPYEYFEISGTPSASLTGKCFLSVDGDGTAAGDIDQKIDLSSYTLGTNGLLLIRATSQLPVSAATTVVTTNFSPDLENGTNTFIIANCPSQAVGDDLDTNDDGIFDTALTSVLDAVSTAAAASGVQYAGGISGTNFSTTAHQEYLFKSGGTWYGAELTNDGTASHISVVDAETSTGADASAFNGMVLSNGNTPSSFNVNYISFKANRNLKTINLNWQTTTEINNQGFEVEKSRNAVNFETIARIDGAGNSQDLTNYYFTDEQPFTGSNYYRLKQKDFDGTVDYSKIIQVFFDAEGDFVSIFPNPLAAGQNLNIEKSESLQLNNIRNINGQSFQKTENLKEGLYFFQFTNPNGGSVVKKLVVN